jgi:hypothetical protein
MEHRIRIRLADSNQTWKNKQEIIKRLDSIPADDTVVVDVLHEGISLTHYGIAQVLHDWVTKTNRNPATIKIDTPNQIEDIGYQFYIKKFRSHFFNKLSIKYHADLQPVTPAEKLFGCFLGKYTADRNCIALDILESYCDYFLMSIMICDTESNKWDKEVYAIGSIDNAQMIDQFLPNHNTNQSLLKFYNQFEIELISETFIYGNTFFPTEKTVRPIMGSKPFLINGPVNFLANLRKLGFKTFDNIWSEAYDQLEGPARWNSIKDTIGQIIQSGYDRNQAQSIVTYNYNHLQDVIENG